MRLSLELFWRNWNENLFVARQRSAERGRILYQPLWSLDMPSQELSSQSNADGERFRGRQTNILNPFHKQLRLVQTSSRWATVTADSALKGFFEPFTCSLHVKPELGREKRFRALICVLESRVVIFHQDKAFCSQKHFLRTPRMCLLLLCNQNKNPHSS